MESSRQQEYSQSGLSSPYPSFPGPSSEGSSADQASAAQYPPQGQDPRAPNFNTSATPPADYPINPPSARSGAYSEYIQRYNQPASQAAAGGNMAQPQSPSIPLRDANDHSNQSLKSDSDVPIDPNISTTSPTYPQPSAYSPYQPHGDMHAHYAPHAAAPMYPGHYQGHQAPMHYGYSTAPHATASPAMTSPVQPRPGVSI
jgi:hypothetical protein